MDTTIMWWSARVHRIMHDARRPRDACAECRRFLLLHAPNFVRLWGK